MDENIYQHFKSNEHDIVDKIANLIVKAQLNYEPVLTDFFNPREKFIAQSLIGRYEGIKLAAFGGYHFAERQRVLFYPDYFRYVKQDFKLALMQINYPEKFAKLHHGQILGTLANSGIKRDVIGDIITDGCHWQFLTEEKLSDYLKNEITRIGKINVRLEQVDMNKLITPINSWNQQVILLSSLRLDSFISSAFKISRSKAKTLVANDLIQVNWAEVSQADYQIAKFDIISVRRYGRIRLDKILGETRKQKLKAEVSIIKK